MARVPRRRAADAGAGPGAFSYQLAEAKGPAQRRRSDDADQHAFYVNTIPVDKQPPFPGNREMERHIKSILRWNALAMVVNGNAKSDGLGGHIASYASAARRSMKSVSTTSSAVRTHRAAATLFISRGIRPPGSTHARFWKADFPRRTWATSGASSLRAAGCRPIRIPGSCPISGSFPPFRWGSARIMAIYQARFLRYLHDIAALADTSQRKVWAFLGDGETDEARIASAAIALASRENLGQPHLRSRQLQSAAPRRAGSRQRQDHPGTRNRLSAASGWNVLKVIWGSNWDPLLVPKIMTACFRKRMMECTLDGEYQRFRRSRNRRIHQESFLRKISWN